MKIELGSMMTSEELEAMKIELDSDGVGITTDDVKADDIKADDVKADDIKADDIKADDIKADDIKADDIKADDIKADDIKADDIKADDIKADDIKADDIKADDIKADDIASIFGEVTTPDVPTMVAPTVVEQEDIGESISKLSEKYEAGDITLSEYTVETGKLQMAQALAQQSAKALDQHNSQVWEVTKNLFFAANPMFSSSNQTLHAALAATYDAMEPIEGMTDMQLLAKAAEKVISDLTGIMPSPAKKEVTPKVKPKEAKIPNTMKDIPSAKSGETGTNKYTDLDALDGDAFETALEKLTPAQRTEYLSAA